MIPVVPHSRVWFVLSGSLVALAVLLLFVLGLKLGIDFTGGTLMEIHFQNPVEKSAFEGALTSFGTDQQMDIGEPYVLRTTEGGFIVRIKDITNEQHIALQGSLEKQFGSYTETRFTTIGPTVGHTLKMRSLFALAVASLFIVLYIAFAFRDVPRKLSPWKFGIIAVIALLHDVLITIGSFTVIGLFTSFEANTLFVSALLIVLGYSVSDTIVIFDRVRENTISQQRGEEFAQIAERSLQQSMTRSINTSTCTLLPLFALAVFGSESIRWFVLTLIIGIVIGTYSSIFLATPMLVYWRKR